MVLINRVARYVFGTSSPNVSEEINVLIGWSFNHYIYLFLT